MIDLLLLFDRFDNTAAVGLHAPRGDRASRIVCLLVDFLLAQRLHFAATSEKMDKLELNENKCVCSNDVNKSRSLPEKRLDNAMHSVVVVLVAYNGSLERFDCCGSVVGVYREKADGFAQSLQLLAQWFVLDEVEAARSLERFAFLVVGLLDCLLHL